MDSGANQPFINEEEEEKSIIYDHESQSEWTLSESDFGKTFKNKRKNRPAKKYFSKSKEM